MSVNIDARLENADWLKRKRQKSESLAEALERTAPAWKFDEGQHPRDKAGRFADKAMVRVGDRDITVVKPKRARSDALVPINVVLFDAMFKGDTNFYLGVGGAPNAIGDRYARFGEFIASHDSIESPEAHVHPDGRVGFTNGRHRYAWLRDHGVTSIPMALDKESLFYAKKYGYISAVKYAWDESEHPRNEEGEFASKGIVAKFAKRQAPDGDYVFEETDDYNSTKFILPDGTRLAHGFDTHAAAATALGVDLDDAMMASIIRYTPGTGAEVGGPITKAQAQHLYDATIHSGGNTPLFVDVFHGRKRAAKVFDTDRVTATTVRNWVNSQFHVQKQEHAFGNTQIQIDPWSSAAASLNMARAAIHDADLVGTGKDVDPNHVTVRFGLVNEDLNRLRSFIAAQAPFMATVTSIELFPASAHSDYAVPVVARIESPELHLLEAEIGRHADFKEKSFPVYKPHCTLAYVALDEASQYEALAVGGTFLVSTVTISHASGVKETIPFGMVNKWDESQHPRDKEGQFTSTYTPDYDAPVEGEWDRSGPSVGKGFMAGPIPKWRQQHRALVAAALQSWVGDPAWFRIHAQDVLGNAEIPPSGSGKQGRAQAEALLWELEHNSVEIPVTVHRGSGMRGDPRGNMYSWSEDINIAKAFAKTYGGNVQTLFKGKSRGLRVRDYTGDSFGEKQWIVRAGNNPMEGRGSFVPPKQKRAKKADDTGRYVTPFVSFAEQGDRQLQLIASLNSSRLATWGFTAEAEVLGMARYRVSAVLDGRTSEFCRLMNGKVFDVADARRKVIEVLEVQDPEDLRVVQPWPSQDQESMDEYEAMSAEELTGLGLHIPPYHPYCRTILRHVPSSLGEGGPPTPTVPTGVGIFQPITAADLQELGIDATEEDVAQWNEHIGMTPVELLSKFSGVPPQEVMTKGQGVGATPIRFAAGDIGFSVRGEVPSGVEFKLGAILDPFTGIWYLSQADLLAGSPTAEAAFLKNLFRSFIEMGEKSTATSLAVGVAGNAAYYAKLGFLPDEVGWESLRLQALADIETGALDLSSLSEADRLLVTQLLQDTSVTALSTLADLNLTIEGRTIGEWILEESGGTWELDLLDSALVAQAKAYLT